MHIKDEIKAYIVENILFGDDSLLADDTSFQESGILDSTGFLEILTYVEENYGIEIPDSEVVPDNFGTLRKIAIFVEKKVSNRAIV